MLQIDGTWMTVLGITINDEAFPHLLIHSELSYSNWSWGRVAQSETLLANRLGLQSTLVKLGAVPRIHQTDNSTVAKNKLWGETRKYMEINGGLMRNITTYEPFWYGAASGSHW
jgi:hypothetical protein